MKFCDYCGKELREGASFCENCGARIINDNVKQEQTKDKPKDEFTDNYTVGRQAPVNKSGLKIAVVIINIISMVGPALLGLFFIFMLLASFTQDPTSIFLLIPITMTFVPLAWMIPMTVMIYNAYKNRTKLSVAFKVCTLLFIGLLQGILLLVDQN